MGSHHRKTIVCFKKKILYQITSNLFNILLNLQLPMQSMPITSKVVSSNPAHGAVYSIPLYVIQFVSDLRQVGGFRGVFRFLHQ